MDEQTRQLADAREREAATREILRVISRSRTNYAPVFDTILRNATALCGAPFGMLYLLRDGQWHCVANAGSRPELVEHVQANPLPLEDTSTVIGSAARKRVAVQVADLMEEARRSGNARRIASAQMGNVRTLLGVPMVKDDDAVGVITLYRKEVKPFNDDDIELVRTFADQAVIAIENVRLFSETQEALEQQKASGEVLSVVSQSIADAQPVFEKIVESCERLFPGSRVGLNVIGDDGFVYMGAIGNFPGAEEFKNENFPHPASEESATGAAIKSGQVVHYPDVMGDPDVPEIARRGCEKMGLRSSIIAPLLSDGQGLGAIFAGHAVVHPFTAKEAALLKSFADQAVIAIQNARLFQALETRTTSLTQSLERQTATSEILRSISASPTDYDPVFDTILENATRLCGAPLGILYLLRDGHLQLVAYAGPRPEVIERLRANPRSIDDPIALSSRTAKTQETIQIADLIDEAQRLGDPSRLAVLELGGVRTVVGVPMLKGNETVGVISLYRQEVKPFAEDDIELVRTFADQAVIAIENVRLFQALQERTADLTQSLERQTATSEILRSISQSPTDYAPVFDTILDNAIRLCGAPFGGLFLLRDDHLQLVAYVGARPEYVEYLLANPLALDNPISAASHAAREQVPWQITDLGDTAARSGDPYLIVSAELEGIRTVCTVPMLKGAETVGVIALYRREIKAFEDDDIALVSTFADQAVIAIENVRLFQALESRNSQLGESLERQTATSEILRSISRSPTDYQPVFDTILENATRLCDAPLAQLCLIHDGGIHPVANRGGRPEFLKFTRDNIRPANRKAGGIGRALSERKPVQAEDIAGEALYLEGDKYRVAAVEMEGIRTLLTVPLLKGDEAIGVIVLYRREVRPFEDRHIGLVETFADQAVIAIENVRLFQALEGRTADLTKSLERQTATSEILRSISQSPTDYTPVFNTILENAFRLCGARFGVLHLLRDEHLHLVADIGARPEYVEQMRAYPLALNNPFAATSRAARDRIPAQIADVRDEAQRSGDPVLMRSSEVGGIRTVCAVPMLKGNETVGVLALYREEVREFQADDIELVSTFADQAVIAIENVRLFQALEGRTADLTKSLERQTATSEILRSISQSPTGYGPIFDTILKNASRLCDVQFSGLFLLRDDHLHLDASLGGGEEFVDFYRETPIPLNSPTSLTARCARERIVQHDVDVRNSERYRSGDKFRVATVELGGIRTMLMVPLFRGHETLGVLSLFRQEVRAFDNDEIELVRTFADQAVIAIENVNLFNETREALERQTASADILKAISDSPTDVQPVFDAITRNAIKLCGGVMSAVFRFDGEQIQFVAQHGWTPEALETFQRAYPRTPAEDKLIGRALLERRVINVADVQTEFRTVIGQEEMGHRSVLVVPLLRDGVAIGVITVARKAPGLFLDRQVDLVITFADQAVIAIENVRLFQALEGRTTELTKTLERQTATSEILRSISRSPTDYAPVFDTILDNATRLCEAPLGLLFLRRDEHLQNVASIGAQPAYVEFLATYQVPFGEQTAVGQAAQQKRAVQIEDVLETFHTDASSPARIATVELEGARTFLAVPMLRNEQVVGVIAIYRREVRRFDDSMVELLETFADQAVIAIENVRLFQTVESRSGELAQSVAELEALGEVAQAVSSSLDLDTVLDTIINRAVQLSRADTGAINEFDEATGTLPFRAAPGMEHMLELPAPRLGEGAVGRAAATRAPVQIADITAPGAYTGHLMDTLADLRIRSLLAVPMMQNDRVLGALVVGRRTPGEFPPEAVRLLRALGTQSAIAIRNARLFREIEDKGRELEAANRHKSEFLANMSHELRTPLNAVIGFSEVLGERMFGELNDKQAEYVTDIHDSGRHLLSLINDILDLSKIEAGAMELDLGRFALTQALDNALTLVRERAERRGIVLQAHLDEELGEMEGDERKLKQILLNLLSNAIKFTGEGGSVTMEARQDDAHVHIAVRDTGVGISEEDLAVIFEEFKQVGTDYARKVEGTGLGLTLTKRFVEMHGGHITVTSEPGAGSVFAVVLPLRAVEQSV